MVIAIARAVHGSQPSHDSGFSIRPTTSPPSKRKADKRLSPSLVGLRRSVAATHLKLHLTLVCASHHEPHRLAEKPPRCCNSRSRSNLSSFAFTHDVLQ